MKNYNCVSESGNTSLYSFYSLFLYLSIEDKIIDQK